MIFTHAIQLLQCALFLLGAICVIPASASQVDKLLEKDNAAKGVEGLMYARGRLALPEMLAQFEREADLEDE